MVDCKPTDNEAHEGDTDLFDATGHDEEVEEGAGEDPVDTWEVTPENKPQKIPKIAI